MSSQNRQRGRPAISDDGSIIDAVTDVFWRNGFADTTISDLSSASGAARVSLYKLYGDKTALLIAALTHYARRFDARVSATLERIEDPIEAVRETLTASADRLADPGAPNGCLRCSTTLTLKGHSHEVDAAIAQANVAFEANMLRLLRADGIARESDPATARVLTAAVNGMVTGAEAGASRADLEDIVVGALDIVRARLGEFA